MSPGQKYTKESRSRRTIELLLFDILWEWPMNHDHAAGVSLEEIVDEGNDADNGGGRSRKGETS